MNILTVNSLTKKFGGITALNGLSFEVEANKITGLIGPNGSGKTVTFDVITGFVKPDYGRVFFNGQDITGLKPFQVALKGIGRTFQLVKLFPRMTVEDILLFAGQPKGLRRDVLAMFRKQHSYEDKIGDVARILGISHLLHERADNLSYGQQKIVEIASLLTMNPEPSLLMLDEPTAGLAENEVKNIKEIVVKLKDVGKTFLIIEHNMSFIMDICEKIIVLNYGVKIAEGRPEEIRKKSEVIEVYLGGDYSA